MSFPSEDTATYLGPYEACYAGHTNDEAILSEAASGGFVTTFLLWLLREGHIDGALLTRIAVVDGKLAAESFLAEDEEAILSARNSTYIENPDFYRTLKTLWDYPGKLAIVCLPCQATYIRRMLPRHPEFERNLVLLIGLFCGHSEKPELINLFLESRNIDPATVRKILIRKGHQSNEQTLVRCETGEMIFPFREFLAYYAGSFFSCTRCLSCEDHMAEQADLSCGDTWLKKYLAREKSHSFVVLRNEQSLALFRQFQQAGVFKGEETTGEEVIQSQKITLIAKKHARPAFARLAPLFGYTMKKRSVRSKAPCHAWPLYYTGAFLTMLSMRLGQRKWFQKLLFRIPMPIMVLYKKAMCFFFYF